MDEHASPIARILIENVNKNVPSEHSANPQDRTISGAHHSSTDCSKTWESVKQSVEDWGYKWSSNCIFRPDE